MLRVLEGGEFERLGSSRTQQVDVRVLAATNANIEAEIEAGRFRSDLLYRLNTIHIHVAAAARAQRRHHAARAVASSTRHAAAAPQAGPGRVLRMRRSIGAAPLSWPGNVRELSHVIERAVLMAPRCVDWPRRPEARRAGRRGRAASRKPMTLDEIEQDAIRAALARHEGNVIAAADELG